MSLQGKGLQGEGRCTMGAGGIIPDKCERFSGGCGYGDGYAFRHDVFLEFRTKLDVSVAESANDAFTVAMDTNE